MRPIQAFAALMFVDCAAAYCQGSLQERCRVECELNLIQEP